MTDIVKFLAARLQEDEAEALKHPDDDSEMGSWEIWAAGETHYPCLPYLRIAKPRVLADVAAKRAILKVHNTWSVVDPEAHYLAEERSCVGCGLDVAGDRLTQDVNKCPVLRALALPYADHPDYRQEWRP